MSHSSRSHGAHGPWLADDDLVTMEGSYTGPSVGDTSPDGTLTVDGLTAPADVVNVGEVAVRMSVGGVLSPTWRRLGNQGRPSSNPQHKRR